MPLLRIESATPKTRTKRARYTEFHDPWTLLPNGEYFRARLERALGHTEPPLQELAVLYVKLNLGDVDRFSVDDERDVGAELLKIYAVRLALSVRAEDMLSRVGQDEFVCLVTGVPGRDQLRDQARKLLDAVSAPAKAGRYRHCVNASIGIAIFPQDGRTADELLGNAEFAMRSAKRQDAGCKFTDEC